MDPDLLTTLKALSDASRLRIVGLLAARPHAVEELADALELSPSTVVHHLKRLGSAGLVEARPSHPYVEYSLRIARLQEVGRMLDEMEQAHEEGALLPGPNGESLPAFDAKVLRSFFEGGRLVSIPTQEKKRLVVLRYLRDRVFTDDEALNERQVNERLALIHPDVAAIRRYLVDHGFVSRSADGAAYCRAADPRPAVPSSADPSSADQAPADQAPADQAPADQAPAEGSRPAPV